MSLEAVTDVLRLTLDSGETVEIDGLGTFRRTSHAYEFVPDTQPRIFIAYVEEDLLEARRLCEALRSRGCAPWLDKDKLLPGQNWPRAIERAIETSDAFIACFSKRSISKRGQFQSELRYALDCALQLPLDQAFFMPVRLERCTIPHSIANRTQYVDLYPDWDRGIKRIVRTIRRIALERPLIELSPA
jgi:hypothetical protein